MRPQVRSGAGIHLRQAIGRAKNPLGTLSVHEWSALDTTNCTCRAASMLEEASELMEVKFDCVTEIEGKSSC